MVWQGFEEGDARRERTTADRTAGPAATATDPCAQVAPSGHGVARTAVLLPPHAATFAG